MTNWIAATAWAPRLVVALIAMSSLGSCGDAVQPVDIAFVAQYGGQDIACGRGVDGLELTDLRLYIHDVRLTGKTGAPVPLQLANDGVWQGDGLAMLDFEDAGGRCLNGTGMTNRVVKGQVPSAEYSGLEFTLGVPFDRNHLDPLQAEAPLGDGAMHWHWRGGYKFLRAGVSSADDGFWIHLGSTGCEGTIRNITGCNSPNRSTVILDGYSPEDDVVVIDLARLLDDVNLMDSEPTDCSSGPAELHCDGPFAALGLDFGNGDTPGAQKVFRIQARN